MKTALALLTLAVSAASAHADDLTGRWGAGLEGGAAAPIAGDALTDRAHIGPDLGLWARYGIDPHWSAGLSYDNLGPGTNSSVRVQPVLGTLGYNLAPSSSWNPTLRAGVGDELVNNLPSGHHDLLGLAAGFGVERFLTHCLSVGANVDWLAGMNNQQSDTHEVRTGFTLGFWFGGAPQKAAPAVAQAAPAPAPAPAAAPTPAPAPAPAPAPIEKPKVSIKLDLQFDTAKALVKPVYDPELKKVAEFLNAHPAAKAEIEGHTDNVGRASANLALSQRRADAVRLALITRFGVDASRLTARGYGDAQPVADNSTAEGRAQNRRVVAIFTGLE